MEKRALALPFSLHLVSIYSLCDGHSLHANTNFSKRGCTNRWRCAILFSCKSPRIWARSAAGSALRSHRKGREFDPPRVHQKKKPAKWLWNQPLAGFSYLLKRLIPLPKQGKNRVFFVKMQVRCKSKLLGLSSHNPLSSLKIINILAI